MNGICPNGILSAGYLDEYFPFFYMEKKQHRGLSLQLWRIVAKSFKCSSIHIAKYLQYTAESAMNGTGWEYTVNGNLAALKKSEIVVDLTLNNLTPVTIKEFKFTAGLSLFEAASNSTEEGWTPYEFFFVFSPPILLLIIISTIIIQLTNKFNTRLRSTAGLCFRCLVSILFSAAVVNLFILHAAVFKGNTIVTAKPVILKWDDIMTELWSGTRNLLESAVNLEEAQYAEMLGRNRPIRPGTTVKVVSELCKRKTSTIAALFDTQVLYISDTGCMPTGCQIYRIPPHGNSTLINENFLSSTFVYLLPKKTPAKIVEKVNEIVLKLFSEEKINEFWMHKELRRPALARKTTQKQAISTDNDPLSLTSLAGIFIAFIAGLIVSFLLLILEITTSSSPHCKRALMFIMPYLE